MAYTVTPEDIFKVRMEVQDVDIGLYVLPDETYEYLLLKNDGSISTSSIEAARMILLRLSMTAKDEIVDIIAIKGSKTAESYRLALELYLKSPQLNPMFNKVTPYAGNISKSDIITNNSNTDTNYVKNINSDFETTSFSSNAFLI